MGEEAPPEWLETTQQTLGTLIKRPKLTAPLLSKPPFRFLHDIVSEVSKVTGFAEGLFEEDELNSAKIKDKDSKVTYLTKIVKCVEFALNKTINIRPTKVVAGLEPENTNQFLQLLFQAATAAEVDSPSVVAKVRALYSTAAPAAPDPAPPAPPPPMPEVTAPPPSMPTVATTAGPAGSYAPAPALEQGSAMAAAEMEPQQMSSAPRAKSEEELPPADEPKRTRPRSARRAPPKLTTNEVRVEKPKTETTTAPNVILEDEATVGEDDSIMLVDNQGEALDTRSMLNTRDVKAEGHGKLVRNILETQQEIEAQESEKDHTIGAEEEMSGGIILGKKGGKGTPGVKLPSKTEINSLRNTIQTLCQSSNPLGRCLEYVQEDIEAMGKELEQWRALRRRRAGELADEEASTESSLVALHTELSQAEALVKEKQAQIRFYKASIIRNDTTIERLLSQVVNTS